MGLTLPYRVIEVLGLAAAFAMFTFFLSTSVAIVNRLSLSRLLPAKPLPHVRIPIYRKHAKLVLTSSRKQQKRD